MDLHNFFSFSIEVPPAGCHAIVEDKPDKEDLARFVKYYPVPVAQVLRKGESIFKEWRHANKRDGRSRWAPFANKEE